MMGPQEQALYNLRDSLPGQDWRPLVTKENVEAALTALPPLHERERTGDENRGVRFYNLSDERLTCTVLDAEGRESLASMPSMLPFDRVQFTNQTSPIMTGPSTVVRVQGNCTYEDYFVNGDSVQHILVLQPAVEEGDAPMQLESGEHNLAQLTAMGYDETAANDALVHSNGDVQAAIAHLADSPQHQQAPAPASVATRTVTLTTGKVGWDGQGWGERPEAMSDGVYFDVRSDGPAVTLTALTACRNGSDQPATIYACEGSGAGREKDAGAWRQVGAGVLTSMQSTRVTMSSPVVVRAGATVGLHVRVQGGYLSFTKGGQLGEVDTSDGTISVLKGRKTSNGPCSSQGHEPFAEVGDDTAHALAGDVEYELA
eukprot:COSAG04_NODE_1876_length_5329_cov_70.433078_3_plen_372_part_00